MAFCGKCGAHLEDGAMFCAECGTRVSGGAASPGVDVHEVAAAASSGEFVVGSWRGGDDQPTGQMTQPYQQAPQATQAMPTNPQPEQRAQLNQQAAQPYQQPAQSTWQPQVTQQFQRPAQPYQQSAQTTQPNQRSHQPSVHYASGKDASQVASKKSIAPIVIAIAAVAIVVAVLALYVVPLFFWHPHDPHEDQPNIPPASQSVSAVASSAASAGAAGSASASAAASDSASAAASAAASASAFSAATPPASASAGSASALSPADCSTTERPTLEDFQWLTGEAAAGNVPVGATRILDFGSVTGSWKAYQFGSGMERFLNATIDAGQGDATITLDWYYVFNGASGQGIDDQTPDSTFSGPWDGGMLDAVGPGRITLAAFWEQDGHQYAVGSFVWPDGATDTVALVRP